MLTTQNPADLDYKGLANIGTWFIGRLQTEQDKNRLLDGLQGASREAAQRFDRKALSEIISGLKSRVFLVNNVHENHPELFETRWCMSYLAGPLTKNQLKALEPEKDASDEAEVFEAEAEAGEKSRRSAVSETSEAAASKVPTEEIRAPEKRRAPAASAETKASGEPAVSASAVRAEVPDGIPEYFLPVDFAAENLYYFPSLYGVVSTDFVDNKQDIAYEEITTWNTPLQDGVITVDWKKESPVRPEPEALEERPESGVRFISLPEAAKKKTNYTAWNRELKDFLYREQVLTLYKNKKTGMVSQPGESERDFVIRVSQEGREERDKKMEDLRKKYEKKMQTMAERIRKAEQRVEREKGQAKQAKLSAAMSLGSTLLGGLIGRDRKSVV